MIFQFIITFLPSENDELNSDTDRLIEEGEGSGCGISWLCDPDGLFHRLIALALMSLLGFGAYFCMDNPGALQVRIIYFFYSRVKKEKKFTIK